MSIVNYSKYKYENVFVSNNKVYARLYDEETNESIIQTVHSVPDIYVPTGKDSMYKSVLSKEPLEKIEFKNMSEYREFEKEYSTLQNIKLYGNKSREQHFIRTYWPDPVKADHTFHTWFIDIETLVLEGGDPKLDWKPYGNIRACSAAISLIQIYDTKYKQYYVFGLEKEFNNKNNYQPENGKLNYFRMSNEENLLKAFIGFLNKRNPTVLAGWNTIGYDYPYITGRIIRVLDKIEPYIETRNGIEFNKAALNGEYVKQLSPVQEIKHRVANTQYGDKDEFLWIGYFLEDYKDLYQRYSYVTLTSYSLDSVAKHELGSEKVNHDEFTDFGEFYRNDFDKFVEYGVQDVNLLVLLDNKLKLLDLAKYIAYYCGVTIDNVRGTIAQWNSFVFNESIKEGLVLPLKNLFSTDCDILPKHAMNMSNLSNDRKEFFNHILTNTSPDGESLIGQKYPGGVTRGTGRRWNSVFSLDFTSLYPSNIMCANIGIDTIILPKDLPKELLDLRAKYFIYYPKDSSPKELEKYDFTFIDKVLRDPVISKEIHDTLKKYNVCATPHGMFFTKSRRSILSKIMDNMIIQRKTFKKEMKRYEGEIEEIKKLLKLEKDHKVIEKLNNDIYILNSNRDKYEVYQRGTKQLINSAYGALALESSLFAGHKEYFSTSVTSVGRVANLFVSQEQSKKVLEIAGEEPKEEQYGMLNYLDCIAQIDTDSVTFDSIININGENNKIGEFYENSLESDSGILEKRGDDNYIKHLDNEYFTLSLNKENGLLEQKRVKYIMAHRVKKRLFKIKHKDKEVTVTEDHSIIILRDKEYLDVKPKDIKTGDKIIVI